MKQNVTATFVSVWDGGTLIQTDCKVDMQTKEVYEIAAYDDAAALEEITTLDAEYIVFPDGTKAEVTRSTDGKAHDGYWYK